MGGFPSTTQINKIMGWRNYATTQQTGASFNSPSFPLASADNYARYFLGAALSFHHTFHHRVRSDIRHKRADGPGGDDSAGINKASKNDRLQPEPASVPRDVFPRTEPAGARLAPLTVTLTARFDMNNLQAVIPGSWIHPGITVKVTLTACRGIPNRPAIWLDVGRRNLCTRYSLH